MKYEVRESIGGSVLKSLTSTVSYFMDPPGSKLNIFWNHCDEMKMYIWNFPSKLSKSPCGPLIMCCFGKLIINYIGAFNGPRVHYYVKNNENIFLLFKKLNCKFIALRLSTRTRKGRTWKISRMSYVNFDSRFSCDAISKTNVQFYTMV